MGRSAVSKGKLTTSTRMYWARFFWSSSAAGRAGCLSSASSRRPMKLVASVGRSSERWLGLAVVTKASSGGSDEGGQLPAISSQRENDPSPWNGHGHVASLEGDDSPTLTLDG